VKYIIKTKVAQTQTHMDIIINGETNMDLHHDALPMDVKIDYLSDKM
jgi:hypothetical protein